ncbi:CAP domain-containing protein [Marinobacter nitratireducens]|nr:CAP domain-containing protein [Marinobacter nitratireducens]
MSLRTNSALYVVFSLLLVGCGGGGSSATATSGSAGSALSDASETNSGSAEGPVTIVVDGCDVEEYQAAMLEYVNAARSRGRYCGTEYYQAAPEIRYNCPIKGAALKHSRDMATNNFFSHIGSDGLRVGDRITETGYQWSVAGENIAAGYDKVSTVMKGWLNSPGHCKNIMDPRFSEFAVERVNASSADYDNYWTQVFAKPR